MNWFRWLFSHFAAIGVLDLTGKQTKIRRNYKNLLWDIHRKKCAHMLMRSVVRHRRNVASNKSRKLAWILPQMLICCRFPPFSSWMRALFLMILCRKMNTEENWLIWHHCNCNDHLEMTADEWLGAINKETTNWLYLLENTTTDASASTHCATHSEQRTVKQSYTNVFFALCIQSP